MNVAVIGASDNPERYSNMAVKLLKEKGHTVFPVHKRIKTVEGLKVYPSIKEVPQSVDTVSLYVSADISSDLADEILAKKPRRIIFNPGAENPEIETKAKAQGVLTENACTLVLLRTSQF
jgi:predicted CoA-binding protein